MNQIFQPVFKPMDDNTKSIYERISRLAQRKHNMTSDYGVDARIAEDAVVSTAAVSKWKRGVNFPSPAKIDLLADLYNVSPEYLVGLSDEEGRPYGLDAIEKQAMAVLWKVAIYARDLPSADRAASLFELAVKIIKEGGSEDDAVGRLLRETEQK